MSQKSRALADKVKDIVNNQKNEPAVNQILIKMGRLLAKKQSLSSQHPVHIPGTKIWLGNYIFATNHQFLNQNKIETIVSCLELPLSSYLPEIEYIKFALKDDKDSSFEQFISKFNKKIDSSKGNVFVHCFSGKSRSVALLLGYLIRKEKRNYQETLKILREIYPLACPNKFFQSILIKNQQQLINEILSEDLLSQEHKTVQSSPNVDLENNKEREESKSEAKDERNHESTNDLLQFQEETVSHQEKKKVIEKKSNPTEEVLIQLSQNGQQMEIVSQITQEMINKQIQNTQLLQKLTIDHEGNIAEQSTVIDIEKQTFEKKEDVKIEQKTIQKEEDVKIEQKFIQQNRELEEKKEISNIDISHQEINNQEDITAIKEAEKEEEKIMYKNEENLDIPQAKIIEINEISQQNVGQKESLIDTNITSTEEKKEQQMIQFTVEEQRSQENAEQKLQQKKKNEQTLQIQNAEKDEKEKKEQIEKEDKQEEENETHNFKNPTHKKKKNKKRKH